MSLASKGLLNLSKRPVLLRLLINLSIFALTMLVLATQSKSITTSLQSLKNLDIADAISLIVVLAMSYSLAASSYFFLARPRLQYIQTLEVQVATGFVNRLLPAGIGGMGIYTLYLRALGCKLSEATAIAIINNILGVAASLILTAGIFVLFPAALSAFSFPSVTASLPIILGAVMLLLIGLLYSFRRRIAPWSKSAATTLRTLSFTFRRRRLATLALVSNIALDLVNAIMVVLAASAIGADITLLQAILVLSFGTLVGVLIPTPGGLGGVEAGLVAGFAAFGIPYDQALAVTFIYRSISYWLPMIPGFVAFKSVQKKYIN